MSDNVKEKYSPEVISQVLRFPLNATRVLREIVDAAETNDPMDSLVRAHRELQNWIKEVRNSYVNKASQLLDTAGAYSAIEMIEPFPEQAGEQFESTYTTKAKAGFAQNAE